MSGTLNFDFPYIAPNQAAKEVTHNEALDDIDAVLETLSGTTLAADTDVALSSAGSPPTAIANNDVLTYDTASGKWKNRPVAVSSTLASDTDVAITSPAQSDIIHYDTTLAKWVNKPVGWYTPAAGFVYQNNVTNLTSWTHAGTTGTVDSGVEQTTGVTSILELAGQGNQFNVGSSLAGCTISFYVYLIPNPANSPWCPSFFQFGCDSLGNGAALVLTTPSIGRSELIATTNWNPPLPGGGIGNVSANAWHQIIITINAAGTLASWTYDGTVGQSGVAVTLAGNYIGLYSSGTYGGNAYFSKIQVQSAAGESWTSSRTISGSTSTVALTYSGTNTPAFQVPALQLAAASGAPTSAGTAGTVGQTIAFGGFLYFCSVTGAAGSAVWNQLSMTAV
jgi:hypothetical protein